MIDNPIDLAAVLASRERLGHLARTNPTLVDDETDRGELVEAWVNTLEELMERKPMYSLEEVADMMGVHTETVRRAIKGGGLKAAKLGRSVRISSFELERWFEACGGGTLWQGEQGKEESLDEAVERLTSIVGWPKNTVLTSKEPGPHGASSWYKVSFVLSDRRHFRCHVRQLAAGGVEVAVFAPVSDPGVIAKPIRRYTILAEAADDVAFALRYHPDDPSEFYQRNDQ